MCGRFIVYSPRWALEKRFRAKMPQKLPFHENFNVAPSQSVPVIFGSAPEEISLATWGFVPHWAKDPKKTKPMINARGETVAEKPYFRDAFKKRRCLILADGFYEWDRNGEKKIPYLIRRKDTEPFAFAGIWDEVTSESDSGAHETVAIVTIGANKLMSKIHDRMPVILHEKDEAAWLDEGTLPEEATALLQQFEDKALEMYQVSPKINKVSFNNPAALEPV
jgi:putative SOS response-associated peptidase YedK